MVVLSRSDLGDASGGDGKEFCCVSYGVALVDECVDRVGAGHGGNVREPRTVFAGDDDVVAGVHSSHFLPSAGSRSFWILRRVPVGMSPGCWGTAVLAVVPPALTR